MSGMLSRVVTALAIPLLPALACMLLITASGVWELFCSSRTAFEKHSLKGLRICYGITLLLINLLICVIVVNDGIGFLDESGVIMVGYVCAGLICLNILREIIEVIIDVVGSIVELVATIKDMINKLRP
jgi:hypothetical protein